MFVSVTAQERQLRKADKSYDSYAFIDAIAVYEQVAEEGYRSSELFKKLGNAYYYNADLSAASKWYGELFSMEGEEITPEYYFRYAQALKAVKEYEKSDAMMEQFNKLTGADSRATRYTAQRNYLEEIAKNSGRYKIKNEGENSAYSDFGPSFHMGNLVFSSARDIGISKRYRHSWNNKPFLNLYGATISDNSSLSNVDNFSSKLNTRYHESTTAFSKDGSVMYFTRNNYNKGRYGNDDKGTNKLKIYRSYRKDGGWTTPEELPFNSDQYSVAHPALSPDEKQLYFASDMPGTLGASDLYVVDINEDGSFGEPKNLGKGINTEARETFPFMSKSGDLYFASDGHVGLGGLDVFVAEIGADNSIGDIYNVGEPVNSEDDDFTFIINSDTNLGYFASNRDGGKGDDDIYSFIQTDVLTKNCEQQLAGVVKDEADNSPLAGSEVTLRDKNNEVLESTYTDESGQFMFDYILDCAEQYFVRASKKDYSTAEELIPVDEEAEGLRKATLLLEKEKEEIKVGDDLADILNIPIIYFDFDKSNIRYDASIELAKVIAVMKQYPNLHIDVRSHTDSRGSDAYNIALSERRNASTRKWIVEKGGIASERLTGRGYGETQHVNRCSNGVKCSEEEHQLNRRSEFIVLKN